MGIIRSRRLDLKQTKPLTEKRAFNSSLNQQEALTGESVLKSYPRRIVLEMTSACNINCIMCGRSTTKFTNTFFQEEWLSLFDPMVENIEEVTLLGWGEPTLHPNFSEFLEWAHKHNLRKFFCTNGTKLNSLIDDIFKYEVELLTVSLDGANKETNDKIRKGTDFAGIIESVKNIVARKKQLNTQYPYISFVMTLMQSNYKQFPDYVRLAESVGIDEVKGVYLTVFDDRLKEESLYNHRDEVEKVFIESEALGEKLGISVKLPELQGEDLAGNNPHKDCYVGWRDFFLGSDGYVRSCMSTPVKLFKINEYNNFDEMWNSKELIDFRRRVNNNSMPDACKNCYQAAVANWNNRSSFDQRGFVFAPEWE